MKERIPIILPKLGESIHSATVVHWLKELGDLVAQDDALLEVSTDKVNSEIPSPVAGVLSEILVRADDEVEVGAPLAIIDVEVNEGQSLNPPTAVATKPCPFTSSSKENKETFLSPAVLRLAQMEGMNIEELKTIVGTGIEGRLTRADLEAYISQKKAKKEEDKATVADNKGEERIQMSGMRKAIAQNMVRSFYQAPHASVVLEADVTDVMQLIAREKENFQVAHKVKLTITSFIVQALTKTIAQYPMLNASLEEETIILKRYVNVGLAVHVDGGLVVPVIRHCQERNLVNIAKAIAEVSTKARQKQLLPDDVQAGTITLTNFGMTGALIGIPIIRYPEVAIVGVGTIQKRVIVRDDDAIAIRQMVYLSLTFDHRVIDGIYGCEFLTDLKRNLESVVYS